MRYRSLKCAGIALFLTVFASVAFAFPSRTYDVQILIYSHITPQTLQLEQWPFLSTQSLNELSPLINRSPTKIAYKLQREKMLLQKNPHNQILLDGSWRESFRGNQPSVSIPIYSAQNHTALKGFITIALSHYFDVHTHLLLTEPTARLQKMDTRGYFNPWKQPDFNFQLLQDRRMKSNELNYLEHPLLGILIKIIPVKP